ncbi:MAG: N5-glutamine methyltransferase family protein [Actinomycetota bacterium]
MKASDLVDEAIRILKRSPAIDHWQKDREEIESEELLEFALRSDEYDPDEEVGRADAARFRGYIARRAKGEPTQLIKGFSEFRGLELVAAPGVFVPRDSSEFLAEQVIAKLRRREKPIFVELACGAGAVSLAVRNETWGTRVYGSDIAADAVRAARRSARNLRLRATFVQGDLYGGLPRAIRGKVDVIAMHPPYVARGEVRELPAEIRRYEPAHTLTDRSVDGLGLLTRAVAGAHEWLKPRGWFLVEVSPDRARAVASVMRQGGLRDVVSTKGGDLKITRVVCGRR